MKNVIFILALLGWVSSIAQSLREVELTSPPATAGAVTSLTVKLDAVNGKRSWCGLDVSYGDGEVSEHLLDDDGIPLRLSHTYAAPGTYTVFAEGKTIYRGLGTAFACEGSKRALTFTVVDPLERQRQLDQRSEKKETDLESQRKQSLAAQELDLKAKEIELKERELLVKERTLKLKEQEIQNQERKVHVPLQPVRKAPPKPNVEVNDGKPSMLDALK